MGTTIALTGMVLSVMPIGEYDKRVVILTRERGKIHAFAKGARRPKSPLLAGSNPFSFGTFHLFEGRTSYNLESTEISNYFRELSEDFEAAYYGMYFCELADYYTKEYLDCINILKLLYKTLQVLGKNKIPKELVRYIFELKILQLNGEGPNMHKCCNCGKEVQTGCFSQKHPGILCDSCANQENGNFKIQDSTLYTLQFIYGTPIEKLYSFLVNDAVLKDLARISAKFFLQTLDKPMKSLEILQECLQIHLEKNDVTRYNI